MTNWCDNTLVVQGKRREVLDFYAKSRPVPAYYALYGWREKPGFGFSGLIPAPEGILKLSKIWQSRRGIESTEWRDICQQIGAEDSAIEKDDLEEIYDSGESCFGPSYIWCGRNWGTNREAFLNGVEARGTRDDFILTLKFDSAWGPPWNWVFHVTHAFPSLRFELDFAVCDVECCGTTVLQDSTIIEERDSKCRIYEKGCPYNRREDASNEQPQKTPSTIDDQDGKSEAKNLSVLDESPNSPVPATTDSGDGATEGLGTPSSTDPCESSDDLAELLESLGADSPPAPAIHVTLKPPDLKTVDQVIPGDNEEEQGTILDMAWDMFVLHLSDRLRNEKQDCDVTVRTGDADAFVVNTAPDVRDADMEHEVEALVSNVRREYGPLVKISGDEDSTFVARQ